MLHHNLILTGIIVTFFIFEASAQSSKEKIAAKRYADFAYADAIQSYESLVEDGHSKQEIFKRLGNANYYNAHYDEAANWYGKLMKLEIKDLETDYIYRYAQSLKSLKMYKESDRWMERFETLSSTDGGPPNSVKTKNIWMR